MAIQKNFNVVGSPVITDEGIASGFATDSYLTATIDFEAAVTIHTKIKTPTSWDSDYSCALEFTTELGNLSVENQNRNFICYSYSQNKDVVIFKPSLNTTYYIKYTIDLSANEKRVSYSLNNIDWSSDVVIADTSMDKGTNPVFLIGVNQRFGSPWLGTIDLKETYAEVDGSIIWNAWKDVGVIPGSVTVDKGYYNVDGTNIIKFTSPIKKTLTEAAADLSDKNDIVLTLDSEGTSSFVLNGSDKTLTGYKKTRKLDSPSVYVDPSKQYILGTEPTGIGCSVKTQKQGGTYKLEYLNLNGSVSYDETTGKLSGFSSSNYATSSSGITFGNSFDLIFNVTVASASTQQTLFYGKDDRGLLFTSGKIAAWFGGNAFGVTNVINGNTYWIRLVWSGTLYTTYSLLDDGTYTLATLPEISSWTQEFTYSSSSNIFSPGYWIGYHSQATDQYARSTFNMGKSQMTTNGVTYRYADGDEDPGSVTFTKGWAYHDGRTYHNKDTYPLSVSTLTGNAAGTVGYKNKLQLGYEPSSDVSVPSISESLTAYAYDMNTDIYLDNTKTKILGTTSTSESWAGGTTPYTITEGNPSRLEVWTRPNLTSATSYGACTDSHNNTGERQEGWRALDGNSSTDFSPALGGGWWKWVVPDTLTFEAGTSTIVVTSSNSNAAAMDIQFFADAAATKPLTEVATLPNTVGANTTIPIINTEVTSTIYMTIAAHSSWSQISEITFVDVKKTILASSGSISFSAGFRYINENVGSFSIEADTTKTFEEAIVGDKVEQMGLYLINKTDLTTDFVLSATEPTTDVAYAEKLTDVYLDPQLNYIYGTEQAPRYSFTMSATPETATITLVDRSNTITGTGTTTLSNIPEGNEVSYNVSASGYITQSGTEVIISDVSKSIELEVATFTLTINPTPDDAMITLTAEGYTQSGNSIIVPSGTSVQWSVTADGYTAQSGTQIVSSDLTLTITLESSTVETSTLSVSTNPADANIEISGDYKEIN